MLEFFESRDWEGLATHLEEAIETEPNDIRSLFRLASLYALLENWPKACDLFEQVSTHRWRRLIALNNLGVAEAHLGKAEPALAAFHEAANAPSPSGAALYNLAILCDFLDDHQETAELLLPYLPDDKSVEEFAQSLYRDAVSALAPETNYTAQLAEGVESIPRLESALFLWTADLNSAFGIAESEIWERHEAARNFLLQGQEHAQRGQYQRALNCYERARTLNPRLEPNLASLVKRARQGMARRFREEVRTLLEAEEYEAARDALESHAAFAETEEERQLATSLPTQEIARLAAKIRKSPSQSDEEWAHVESLIGRSRRLIEAFGSPDTPPPKAPVNSAESDEPGERFHEEAKPESDAPVSNNHEDASDEDAHWQGHPGDSGARELLEEQFKPNVDFVWDDRGKSSGQSGETKSGSETPPPEPPTKEEEL